MATTKQKTINNMSTGSILWYVIAKEYMNYERYIWPTLVFILLTYIFVR